MSQGSLYIRILLVAMILIMVNVLSSYFFGSIDLTSDKRFTLTEKTKEIVPEIKDFMSIRIFLEGEDFPAGFRRLRTEVEQFMKQLRKINPNVHYQFVDPTSGTDEERAGRLSEMQKDGLDPVRLMVSDGASSSEKLIFPYAQINYGERTSVINLLESQTPGQDQEVILNNSAALLEYKFASTINHLLKYAKDNIAFLAGHGELEQAQTAALEKDLRRHYNTARMVLDSLIQIDPEIAALVVAKPKSAFSERDKFLIDQYVMNGGSILWLIDRTDVNLDSIGKYGVYVPTEYDLNLDDLWFKWGFRPNADLVLDIECTRIPLQVGQIGGKPDYKLFPWFYHPLLGARSDHPVANNLDRINLLFAGSIDTVRTGTDLKKTPLLKSSDYARIQRSPMRLGFDMAHQQPDPSKFTRSEITIAWLIEGEFPSLYKNRVPQAFQATLNELGSPYRERSSKAKQIIVSDGDIAKNLYRSDARQYSALGFNKFENFVFGGNRDFVINAIDYLIDDSGVMDSRKKELKLRILDGVKADNEAVKWQLINIVLPLLGFLLFALGNHWWRKKKYTVKE